MHKLRATRQRKPPQKFAQESDRLSKSVLSLRLSLEEIYQQAWLGRSRALPWSQEVFRHGCCQWSLWSMTFKWKSGHFHLALKAWPQRLAASLALEVRACTITYWALQLASWPTLVEREDDEDWRYVVRGARLSFEHWRLCIMLSLYVTSIVAAYGQANWHVYMQSPLLSGPRHTCNCSMLRRRRILCPSSVPYQRLLCMPCHVWKLSPEEPVLVCVSMTQSLLTCLIRLVQAPLTAHSILWMLQLIPLLVLLISACKYSAMLCALLHRNFWHWEFTCSVQHILDVLMTSTWLVNWIVCRHTYNAVYIYKLAQHWACFKAYSSTHIAPLCEVYNASTYTRLWSCHWWYTIV